MKLCLLVCGLFGSRLKLSEFIYLFKYSVRMTVPYTSTCMVTFCLVGPALYVSGSGGLCLRLAASLFCLLLPSEPFNMLQFPITVCVSACARACVCVKRIISACMSVIESAAVEATTSSSHPPPLPCPPLSVSYSLSFSLSFLSPHFFCKPLFSPSLPIPCNKLTHRKL